MQIEDIVNWLNDMGIPVHERAPDQDAMIIGENGVRSIHPALGVIGRNQQPVRLRRAAAQIQSLSRPGAGGRAPGVSALAGRPSGNDGATRADRRQHAAEQ